MARVKGGTVTHLRHKKVLKYNKGNFGTRSTLFKRANETMLKSMWYAYRDRRTRKRDLRKLWNHPHQRSRPFEWHVLQPVHLWHEESRHPIEPQSLGRSGSPRSQSFHGCGRKSQSCDLTQLSYF